ncbi:hypothetical protein KKB40_02910, partial [Patescibacteria group bacterium]|nr:hypothetical protein [Patescibacteria group bacterium]
ILFIITTLFLLALVKGNKENSVSHQTSETRNTKVGSPFESSGSTSRYALTEAIVEDGTFFLNENRARFSAPDMVEYKGKFFSIFTPGISFVGIPFYIFGKYFELAQLFTFLSTVLFALLNVFLVGKLARKFGVGLYSSFLAGFLFLFATNALSYALTFTQHHASTAIILLALLNAFGKRTLLKNLWLGILVSAGLLFDIPNILMMAPIGIYISIKHFHIFEHKEKIKIAFKLTITGLVVGLIPLVGLFGWYNKQLSGSYTKTGQTIGRSYYFEPLEIKQMYEKMRSEESFNPGLPFVTRRQLEGLHILLTSNERGWIYYSPIVIIGILGLFLAYKKRQKRELVIVAIATVLTSIVIYSLFGGLGGWAFGPRYLIPATAVLSAFIGVAVDKYKKKPLFILPFFILAVYSIGVNVLGSMTTTQVPPRIEAINLADPIPYTYEYNWQLMTEKELNSSLVYNLFLSNKLESKEYMFIFFLIVLSATTGLYTMSVLEKKTEGEK